jgi:hypothetical protein
MLKIFIAKRFIGANHLGSQCCISSSEMRQCRLNGLGAHSKRIQAISALLLLVTFDIVSVGSNALAERAKKVFSGKSQEGSELGTHLLSALIGPLR